jgi:hypothetical protein
LIKLSPPYRKLILAFFSCFLFILTTQAQQNYIYGKYNIYRPPLRVFANYFTWTVTTGYGNTRFSHQLEDFYFFQNDQGQFLVPITGETLPATLQGYQNWLNSPSLGNSISVSSSFDVPNDKLDNPVNNPALTSDSILFRTDTSSLGFAGGAPSIPLTLQVHFSYQKFRVGFGYGYERQWVKSLEPSIESVNGIAIRDYQPNFKGIRHTRLFGMLGYEFYRWWYNTFNAEIQVGRIRSGPELDRTVLSQGLFINLGVSFEHIFSEYFRLVVRPSYDIKQYSINLPEGNSINHRYNAMFLQVGVSIRIPEIPRSPMKSDHVQLKHVLYDPEKDRLIEVRGQPFWKRQNPKVGENHRKLWRYKFKNRRKMHPY